MARGEEFAPRISRGLPPKPLRKEAEDAMSPQKSRATVCPPPGGGRATMWQGELAAIEITKRQRQSGFYIRRLPPPRRRSPFCPPHSHSQNARSAQRSLHFSLLFGVSLHKNTALWCFCLLTPRGRQPYAFSLAGSRSPFGGYAEYGASGTSPPTVGWGRGWENHIATVVSEGWDTVAFPSARKQKASLV